MRSLAAESEWVKQHFNIFLVGATGVGKSWLAAALAARGKKWVFLNAGLQKCTRGELIK